MTSHHLAAILSQASADGSSPGRFSPVESLWRPFEWLLVDVYGTGMNLLSELLGVRMLGYPYMQRAYLAAVCIAVIGPLVGTFLVHRELSMLADTLAHTAFAGVAVGLFLNTALSLSLSPLLTAMIVAVGTALLVDALPIMRTPTVTRHWRSSSQPGSRSGAFSSPRRTAGSPSGSTHTSSGVSQPSRRTTSDCSSR